MQTACCTSTSYSQDTSTGQITVIERDSFEIHVREGDVIQRDPTFFATSSDAEVYFHSRLNEALADAETEFQNSVEAGWIPYNPITAR